MEADRVALKPFLLSLAALAGAEGLGSLAVASGLLPPLAVLGLVRIVEIGLFLLVFYVWGEGPQSLGLGARQINPGIRSGLIWSAVFGGVVLIGFVVLYGIGRNPFAIFGARLPDDVWDKWLYLILGGLAAPVAEEIFFRGILYGYFRRLGILAALLISSAVFIFAHPSAGFSQIVGGVVFALAYERAGWLMTPIVIHVLGNLAIFGVGMV